MSLLISHIPKSAGSSLKSLIEKLNPDTQWVYQRELKLINPNFDWIEKFRAAPAPSVVMGHFSYGVHRLLGIQPSYATILRNPIERVVSLYRYQKNLTNSAFANYFRDGLSLKDFVSKEITEMTNNHACRVIAGIAPDAGMTINDDWLLNLAIHNLRNHYVLVGTLNSPEDFLTSLGQLLHWPEVSLPRINITEGETVELDTEERRVIIEKNSLDIDLFNYVLALNSKSHINLNTLSSGE